MPDFAVHATHLGKCYQIYERPSHRLRQFFLPRVNRWLGRGEQTYFRDFWALRDVSFEVRRGETVGIIGRNGSGKSTLLQMICGTLAPTQGEVRTSGRVAALLELGSGFNPEFSGRENVFLNGAILGLSPAEIAARFDEIVAFAGIGDFIDQPVKTYSSGMVVRLAFATAIHVHPDILVVDEALSVGDTAFQAKCLERIRQLQLDGVSILLVTHSSNTIIEYCDRALYMKSGRMIMDGPCRQVVECYAADIVNDEGGVNGQPLPGQPAEMAQSEFMRAWIENEHGEESTVVGQGERFKVCMQVRFNRPVESPGLGIQLKSPTDIELWSATTHRLGLSLAPGREGEIRDYAWALEAVMGAGKYVVALGIGDVSQGGYKRHFRLHYATHFEVVESASSGRGWLWPKATLEVASSGIRK